MDPLHGKEHAADMARLPPAVCLDVAVADADGDLRRMAAYIPQGKGKLVPKSGLTYAEIAFRADGATPVRVQVRSTDGEGGVWLNELDIRACPCGVSHK
jgi:hypothetical protein